MQLDALIAEDEDLLRQSLVAQLQRLWPELRLVAECEDGACALERLAELKPDLAFLDIRMPASPASTWHVRCPRSARAPRWCS